MDFSRVDCVDSEEWWEPSARVKASERFDGRVVDLFFDGMEATQIDFGSVRDSLLPLLGEADGLPGGPFRAAVTFAGRDEVVDHLTAHHDVDAYWGRRVPRSGNPAAHPPLVFQGQPLIYRLSSSTARRTLCGEAARNLSPELWLENTRPGCDELHLKIQSRYNTRMSTSTVGFAVADEDQERLARLVQQFGGGNRSAYLRATLPVMESLARAERLRELQARNAERAAAAGQGYESLLADIRKAYKGGAPER